MEWVARKARDIQVGKLAGDTTVLLTSLLLIGIGVVVAFTHHYYTGIGPSSRRFVLEPVSEHAQRAQPFLEQINSLPPDVPISVGSNLYPHVAHRELVYLFPTVSDAQFILLDVTGPTSPVGVGDQHQIVRELLEYGEFGMAGSDHGFLLLERDLDEYRQSSEFDQVFLAGDGRPQVPLDVNFGGLLQLVGYNRDVRPVVRPELVVEISTYWQALAPLEDGYRLAFFFWDEQGQLVRLQPEERALHWYPTWLWEPGEVIKVRLPPLPVGDLPHFGVAVLRPGASDQDLERRVTPITSASEQTLYLWEQNTIMELTEP